MVRLIALVLFVAAACGNINRKDPYDAGVSEPPPPLPDAAQLHEAREFVSGGARMSSATYTFDVQVGHAVQQGKASGATYQFQASPAVKP
jgi:hypothetical protein